MTTPAPNPRPRPLRILAAIVGGLTALVAGLVGSGLLTTDQGNAITGIITAILTLLATFGIALAGERTVTPLIDPRDDQGRALMPGPAQPDRTGW